MSTEENTILIGSAGTGKEPAKEKERKKKMTMPPKYAFSGLSLLVTLWAIALFSYCSFLGLDYVLKGKLLLCAAIALAVFVLLLRFMIQLIKSKATRNAKDGQPRELKAALIVTVILVLSSPFFSQSFRIYDSASRGEFRECVTSTIDSISDMSDAYRKYAQDRIDSMEVRNKNLRPSLERRLLVEDLEEVKELRMEWLESLPSQSIWNVYTATNMHMLQVAAESWEKNYREISDVYYEGEQELPFEHSASAAQISQFNERYSQLHMPDWRGVMATLLCMGLVGLCYYTTRRPRTRIEYKY